MLLLYKQDNDINSRGTAATQTVANNANKQMHNTLAYVISLFIINRSLPKHRKPFNYVGCYNPLNYNLNRPCATIDASHAHALLITQKLWFSTSTG
jgi:hypothetical protein